jgi:two-component system chemotaxis response regulator CheV
MVDLKFIDEKTSLAGTNRMEILMFMLQDKASVPDAPLFGINVFKVREIIVVPKLFEGPNKKDSIAGTANIRGKAVPVIDSNEYFGYNSDCPPSILVVSEFNGSTQGFLAHEVHDISQLKWADMIEPPELVTELSGYVLTGKIKADPRFDGVPVLMHSSLSASENERLAMKVGADAYSQIKTQGVFRNP